MIPEQTAARDKPNSKLCAGIQAYGSSTASTDMISDIHTVIQPKSSSRNDSNVRCAVRDHTLLFIHYLNTNVHRSKWPAAGSLACRVLPQSLSLQQYMKRSDLCTSSARNPKCANRVRPSRMTLVKEVHSSTAKLCSK